MQRKNYIFKLFVFKLDFELKKPYTSNHKIEKSYKILVPIQIKLIPYKSILFD